MKIKLFLAILICSGSIMAQHREYAFAHTQDGDLRVSIVQLWENGPWFADFNIGAVHRYETGGYYCWGGVINCDPNQDYAFPNHDIQGTSEDVATTSWGNNWVIPSAEEMQGLLNHCEYHFEVDASNGSEREQTFLVFQGKDLYAQDYILLPIAGNFWPENGIRCVNRHGVYWTSTYGECVNPPSGCALYINATDGTVTLDTMGCSAFEAVSVRAIFRGEVTAITEATSDYQVTKVIKDRQVVIIKNGIEYNVVGMKLQ